MALSAKEIQEILQKLRAQYDECAKKHSPKWFDRSAFEDRYRMAMRNEMDLGAFTLAEVATFEKLKGRYETKKKEKEQGSFIKKVDDIIEENYSRIKKYPEVDFHPDAHIEVKHLYGALFELAQYYLPILWLVFTDYHKKNQVADLEHKMQYFALPRGTRPPTGIEDYMHALERPGMTETDIDKIKNGYLKESAFMLYDLITFCDSYINSRLSELEQPLNFEKNPFAPEKAARIIKEFSSCTGYGAILKIKEQSEEILENFRLVAFKPK